MRELPHPAASDLRLSEIMRAFADPVRLELVRRISVGGEDSCAATSDGISLHPSTISHHFRVLRETGVTRTRVDGRSRHVRLNPDLETRYPGLLDSVLTALSVEGPLADLA